jgi:hypothetical protein
MAKIILGLVGICCGIGSIADYRDNPKLEVTMLACIAVLALIFKLVG